jgi:hypothetical protein
MNNLLLIGMFVLMIATVVVLMIGVVLMARGGAVNEKFSNKLMVARVTLQGAAILILGLLFYLGKQGS